MILGASYTLWMYKKVIFGEVTNSNVGGMQDISSREFLILAILAVMVLGFGIYPLPLTEVMHVTVDNLLEHVARTKL